MTQNNYSIYLATSLNNTVSGNNITNNNSGIWLTSSSNNTLSGNNVGGRDGGTGIYLAESSDDSIFGNNVTNNGYGIHLLHSSNNSISRNYITANVNYGIYLEWAGNNKLDHNNFINNTNQVYSAYSANILDDGYPSGGNYWSDYNGTDANHDGIGDTPYIIDVNNTDHYPLMTQYIIPEFPTLLIPTVFMIATLLAVIIYRRKTDKRRDIR